MITSEGLVAVAVAGWDVAFVEKAALALVSQWSHRESLTNRAKLKRVDPNAIYLDPSSV